MDLGVPLLCEQCIRQQRRFTFALLTEQRHTIWHCNWCEC